MKHFSLVLGIWIAFVNTLIICFAMPLIIAGKITLIQYFSNMPLPFILGIVLVTLIPLPKWGNMIAGKLGTKPGTFKQQLIASFFMVIIIAPIISFSMMWWNVHRMPNYTTFLMSTWISALPKVILAVYISANIAIWSGIPLVKRILSVHGQRFEQYKGSR